MHQTTACAAVNAVLRITRLPVLSTAPRRGSILKGVNMASGIRMWIPFAIAYAASFFQRTSLQTISDLLAIEFNVGAYEIGLLAGAYFATYAVIQVPAGIISDRVGPQKAVLISMVLSFLGTSVFLMAWSYPIALTARSITAIGDAFAFSALIKYVALYLPAHRFGLMSGASQVSGYVGGAIATAPLAICADAFGWRSGFLVLNARAGSGNLNNCDKCNFCLRAA